MNMACYIRTCSTARMAPQRAAPQRLHTLVSYVFLRHLLQTKVLVVPISANCIPFLAVLLWFFFPISWEYHRFCFCYCLITIIPISVQTSVSILCWCGDSFRQWRPTHWSIVALAKQSCIFTNTRKNCDRTKRWQESSSVSKCSPLI